MLIKLKFMIRTLEDKIYDFLFPSSGTNIIYGDWYFYKSLCDKYGKDFIDKKIQEIKKKYNNTEV